MDFRCDKCGKCFERKFNLTRHLSTHAQEDHHQHLCIRCPKSYSRFSDCVRHMRRAHGNADRTGFSSVDLDTLKSTWQELLDDSAPPRSNTPVLDEMEQTSNGYESVSPADGSLHNQFAGESAAAATNTAPTFVQAPMAAQPTQINIGRMQCEMSIEAGSELRVRGPVRLLFNNGTPATPPTLLISATDVVQVAVHKL
jgi:hypothetical protein